MNDSKNDSQLNMKKASTKSSGVLKILVFLFVLLFIFSGVFNILSFKYGDGIFSLDMFYKQQPDTVDVLVLGSSHAFENINTSILYSEYGLAAYDLCGSLQPLWNTYYYLKEALKTQSPKLVVLEAYGVNITTDFSDDSRIIKNNFGLNLSLDKINSLLVSAPQEKFTDYLFEPYQYHTRYSVLSKEDFEGNLGKKIYENFKGFGCNFNTLPSESPEAAKITKTYDMYGKTEEYYRKIIELCKEKEIPLQIIVTPYIVPEYDEMRFNRAQEIANEYNVPFVNYNKLYNELGFDFSTDMADAGHNNHLGNVKTTRAFAELIKQNFDLPDRRNDPKWHSWELDSELYYRNMDHKKLQDTTDLNAYIPQVINSDYTIVISANGNLLPSYQAVSKILDSFAITYHYDLKGVWVMQGAQVIFNMDEKKNHPYFRMGSSCVDFREDGCYISDEKVSKVADGINIIIYDRKTDSIADNIGLSTADLNSIVR